MKVDGDGSDSGSALADFLYGRQRLSPSRSRSDRPIMTLQFPQKGALVGRLGWSRWASAHPLGQAIQGPAPNEMSLAMSSILSCMHGKIGHHSLELATPIQRIIARHPYEQKCPFTPTADEKSPGQGGTEENILQGMPYAGIDGFLNASAQKSPWRTLDCPEYPWRDSTSTQRRMQGARGLGF